mgnify:CR=1 FL=1
MCIRDRIEGIEHLVIGVTGKKGEMFGENQDYMALIPASTFTQYYWDEDESNVEIVLESKSQKELRKTMDEIIGHFRVIRKLKPSEKNNFEIRGPIYEDDKFVGTLCYFRDGRLKIVDNPNINEISVKTSGENPFIEPVCRDRFCGNLDCWL